MKKLLLFLAALALFSFTARAQVYVGGSINLDTSSGYTALRLSPEIGYTLNEKMAVGSSFSVDFLNHLSTEKHLTFSIQPYFRYFFLNLGPARFFADAMAEIDFGRNSTYIDYEVDEYYDPIPPYWTEPESFFGWEIAIRPGIALPITEKLSAVCRLGYLGYSNGGGFSLSLYNDLYLGLYFSF